MRKALIGLAASILLVGGAPITAAMAQHAASTPKASSATAAPANASSAPAGTSHGFSTEAAAKAHCPSDTVVWGNSSSKVLHVAGSKSYGKTKRGSYMCESEATKLGYHVAKGEKHS